LLAAGVMTPLAVDTSFWIAVAPAVGLLFALAVIVLFAVYLAAFDGGADDIAEVQRFIQLTEEARRVMPRGLSLLDGEDGATAATAIARFQAKKDEARCALWPWRDGNRTDLRGVLPDVARLSAQEGR
jgi:hypothetical protein